MECQFIVGENDCTFNDIINIVDKSPVNSLLLKDWPMLGLKLKTPYILTRTLRSDLMLEKKGYLEVIEEILVDWKSRNASKATLVVLVSAMRECGWNDIADTIVKQFGLGAV